MDILINLAIPALSKKYDILMPDFLTVQELLPLMERGCGYSDGNSQELCARRFTVPG